MIRAIFYSKFDIHEGPKVIHQVPNNSITAPLSSDVQPLIQFSSISSTIIPRQNFCSFPLTLLSYPYRVLSYPVCLTSPMYARNEFIFSFSLLLHHRTSTPAYASIVAKLAGLFKHLEDSTQFLSGDPSPPNTGRIYALCEILLEDLNNYCEAMIPINDSNTLNIKLFPAYPPPPLLAPHHVPLPTVRLAALVDSNWDLTMIRILHFVNGVNSMRGIARLADADYKLVRKAIAHLVSYGCVILLDIFNYSASYAPSSEMGSFIADVEMQEEGRRYALTQDEKRDHGRVKTQISACIDCPRMVELYCSLKQGLSVKAWCLQHAEVVGVIDIRRFITFGVIKGFLYRVHKYVILNTPVLGLGGIQGRRDLVSTGSGDDRSWTTELTKFLDGTHCFDEICTELMITERELLRKLKTMTDVQIIQK